MRLRLQLGIGVSIWLLVSLLAPQIMAQQTSPLTPPRPKKVLLLFSDAMDLPGNVLFEQTLRADLLRQNVGPLEFFAEHLDSARFSDESQYKLFQDYLRNRYKLQQPDLVVSIVSVDFSLTRLPGQVFSNTPAVFAAVTDAEPPPDIKNGPLRGIIQHFDVEGTLNLITSLHPKVDRVVIIGGTMEGDRLVMENLIHATTDLPEIHFEFWTNRPLVELEQAVSYLPDRTVVLLSSFRRDGAGQRVYVSQVAQRLVEKASVPLYILSTGGLGSGAVGGALVDPERLGLAVSRLSTEALRRSHAPTPAIEILAKGKTTVDWRALKRWSLHESRLPPEALVRFKPQSLWDDYKGVILLAIFILLAQALTIAGLLVQRAHRRRAEREIQAQQAELAHVTRVSTLGQLASSLAHELNQPLGAILRNAEAAEIFLRQENPDLEELRAIVSDIRRDDERAGGVIDRLRALLKRRALEFSSVNLTDVLHETLGLVKPDASAKHVKLNLDLPEDLPPIRADRVQLQQVLLNLMINGVDAMHDAVNGDRNLRVSARQVGKTVEVTVADTGPGFSPQQSAQPFKPFYTTKPNGLGMGLVISRSIIEAHGGRIEMEANQPHGAIFRFAIPVHSSEPSAGL